MMLVFGIDRDELSHFEAWPGLGWTRLYFDGVKLPRSGERLVRAGPGRPHRGRGPGNRNESARVRADPGHAPVKTRTDRRPADGERARAIFGELTDRDTTFTAVLDTKKLFGQSWALTFFDRDGRPLDARLGPGPSNPHDASGHGMRRQTTWYNLPLDRVGAVEISPP